MSKLKKVLVLVGIVLFFVGIVVTIFIISKKENDKVVQADIIEATYTDDNARPIKEVKVTTSDRTVVSISSVTDAEELVGSNATADVVYEDGEVVTKPCYIVRTIDKNLKEIKYTDGNYIKIELPLN